MKTYQTLAFILALSVIACLNSCMKKDGPVPLIDLTNVTQSVSLNLSDLVSDIKIIRLETSEASLIGADRHFIVGENYIICYSMQNILQFDAEGKFIRCLAISGKGPFEFIGQPSISIDPNEINLYFKSQNSAEIQCIDLRTGKFKASVPLAYPAGVFSISCIQDNQILVVPTLRDSMGYYMYCQDTLGNMTNDIVLDKKPELTMITSFFSHIIDENFIYYHNSSVCGDTIFKIEKFNLKPAFVFNKDDNLDFDLEVSEGYYKGVHAVTKNYFIFSRTLIKKNNYAFSMVDTKYYWSEGLTGDQSEINQFYFDIIGKRYSGDEVRNVMNYAEFNAFKNQFVASMEAVTLKETALSADDLDLPEEVYQRLKSLDTELDENDNPVLFVGSLL